MKGYKKGDNTLPDEMTITAPSPSRRTTKGKSHHFFSGVPYHHVVGKLYDAARLGAEFMEELPEDKVV